ncbi:LysR substrate-binding domain-containing protein [Metapseudomonas furukawaii]|uniref:Probable transcriptional regulator n=1 Tax=Metapseudomonas furukawaii TaxID=1149133 RepID=A0AAD1C191_METFU|nr:LysR substrate-binding domain-containing protein [Pseudomonas furukawaii]ELS27863.1 transcriptional regulator, LysR family [Pseudomonas furukawaii]BAU74163.1 probable transcriptional regulator [Pseudomonas furukawaii]
MQISHSQLRAFHAVAEAGSFTRAAERLCLSQPAVSDQVRKLEEYYGVMVFHRDKRAVRLTEVGERLLGLTRRLFDISIDAHELLMDYRDLTTGSLVLAVDAPVHVLPYVARFCARYPGIDVRIESANTDVVLQRLFSHSADLALLGRSIDDERLHSVPLRRDPMIAFVAKDHPWARRKSIRLADLDGTPLVLREQGSVTRQTLEEEMAAAGFTIRKAIEVEGREGAMEAVAFGIGVGVISAAELGFDSRLRALPIIDCRSHFTETLACLRAQSSRRILMAFLQLVSEG